MENISIEVEKIIQKNDIFNQHIDNQLCSLINKLKSYETIIATAIISDDQVTSSRVKIITELKQTFMESNESIKNNIKSFHINLSKFGKQINKELSNNYEKLFHPIEFDKDALEQAIAMFLFQTGQINAAKTYIKESNISFNEKDQKRFMEFQYMSNALKRKELEPIINWCLDNRDELLEKQIYLEYECYKIQFIQMILQNGTVSDLFDYAKNKLKPFHNVKKEENRRLIGSILYRKKTIGSPYEDLFQLDELWKCIMQHLIEAKKKFLNLSKQPVIATCFQAAEQAYPNYCKMMKIIQQSGKKINEIDELPFEMNLSDDLHYHNIFSCPVSHECTTIDNPPMLLKCGHVICCNCVNKLSSSTFRFKCPTCPSNQTADDTSTLHL